jgi:Ca2+-transporting ATPase
MKYPIDYPFALSADELSSMMQTDCRNGISQSEAEKRAKWFGPNSYKTQSPKSIWLILIQQFRGPIVYLLLFGASVSVYFKDYLDAIAIIIVILINALIGFFMELQARSSMNALKKMDIILAKVIRNGTMREIPSEQLVPGDLVFLEAGDLIPADCRLVKVHQLQCEESVLTGESLPSDKHTQKLAGDVFVGDQHNMVFKGTSVINGNGEALITGIAQNTQLGMITSLVESSSEIATPLDKKLDKLSRKLIRVTLAMTAIFAVTGIIKGKRPLLIIETSIALTVAAIPEGLPIVATVALSYGMLLMARRNVIVKKPSAVETLGSTGIILTDKTGTLTENKIYADTLAFPGESVKVHIENSILKFPRGEARESIENFNNLLLAGVLCNNAIAFSAGSNEEKTSRSGDPLEIALIQLATAAGLHIAALKKQYPRIAEVPFSSEIMMMGTLHKTRSGFFAAAKGSVERLLEKCSKIQSGPMIKEMDSDSRNAILLKGEKMASGGLRVLAFAYRADTGITVDNYLDDLVYTGMAGFLDPPRIDIKGAIFSCRNAGIKVVMITGDHPHTALNIARKVGLIEEDDKHVITGSELLKAGSLNDAWKERILATSVFARTTPRQKLDIAAIFQNAGYIVAMTGDGINDAPALKKADIGIAMGIRGTQVAKETASMILKDDSFTSIAEAVSHGREIFQNIQKFVIYLVSCNLSEIFIVTILGIITPLSTLLPLQILFLNMVTDIFPALALGLGTGDKTVMLRPPRDPQKEIITNKRWLAIALYAAVITATVIATVLYCKKTLAVDDRVINNMAFVTLTFAQLFHVFNMSSARSETFLNEITRNKFVWIAIFICASLLVLAFWVPEMRVVLGLTLLPANLWLTAIAASTLPLLIFQIIKSIQARRT